eukprot:1196290-Prorocentrum_minimum.AAC.2
MMYHLRGKQGLKPMKLVEIPLSAKHCSRQQGRVLSTRKLRRWQNRREPVVAAPISRAPGNHKNACYKLGAEPLVCVAF